MRRVLRISTLGGIALVTAIAAASPAWATEAAALDGRALGLLWCAPFAGLILSIALFPLLTPTFWGRHYGKIAGFWSLAFLLPLAGAGGAATAFEVVRDTVLDQYIPFIVLMFSLFTVSGGVRITGGLSGTPASNTALLMVGTVLASVIGTAGAPILLIRPLIHANAWRRHSAPVFIFFIFLVCNIGGALTPIGNPPLFLGFLQGVAFFWPATHLWAPTILATACLLVVFFVIDSAAYRRETPADRTITHARLGLEGKRNLALLAALIATVLLCGIWEPGIDVNVLGDHIALQNLVRDCLLVFFSLVSLKITHADIHQANGFSWGPMLEVAKLFAAIFIALVPAIAILQAGAAGALAPWIHLLTAADGGPVNALYFWFSGGLSSILDNAPTYLMFFNTAGGDPQALMGPLATTLAAISAGAQFMGANTYIGNAPNFMVKSICEERGIKMPSFFGYMLWSGAILEPLFLLLMFLFFWP